MSVLRIARDAGVLRLTLNRPEKRNALSADLIDNLLAALRDAGRDASVRAILLEGAGASFCAGGDLDAMRARRGDPAAAFEAQRTRFGPLAREMLTCEKPIVAHVNGDAFGAGLMLVLAADFAVAHPRARFSAAFARVGLVPDTAGTWLLPTVLGLRAAKTLVLHAEPVDSTRAQDLGIVTDVREDAATHAGHIAARLASGATRALGLARRAMAEGASGTLDEALAREAALQAICYATTDHAEGVDAFLAKREPAFTGR